jgi:hypothetical protein
MCWRVLLPLAHMLPLCLLFTSYDRQKDSTRRSSEVASLANLLPSPSSSFFREVHSLNTIYFQDYPVLVLSESSTLMINTSVLAAAQRVPPGPLHHHPLVPSGYEGGRSSPPQNGSASYQQSYCYPPLSPDPRQSQQPLLLHSPSLCSHNSDFEYQLPPYAALSPAPSYTPSYDTVEDSASVEMVEVTPSQSGQVSSSPLSVLLLITSLSTSSPLVWSRAHRSSLSLLLEALSSSPFHWRPVLAIPFSTSTEHLLLLFSLCMSTTLLMSRSRRVVQNNIILICTPPLRSLALWSVRHTLLTSLSLAYLRIARDCQGS